MRPRTVGNRFEIDLEEFTPQNTGPVLDLLFEIYGPAALRICGVPVADPLVLNHEKPPRRK